ncbi:Ribosomal protein S6 kinase-like 1 [Dissostichus eleginoides]|uniref:Ribosomal protein S6 kinase-like 1 n=1 Tax=Dissostichus eleginoides TaxID=100907 RepID=A0AAD9C4H4_DISEL|nr:Ribosomal protein S6 kinase-like 1 [Dissostichus eleginoides]
MNPRVCPPTLQLSGRCDAAPVTQLHISPSSSLSSGFNLANCGCIRAEKRRGAALRSASPAETSGRGRQSSRRARAAMRGLYYTLRMCARTLVKGARTTDIGALTQSYDPQHYREEMKDETDTISF